MVFLETILVVFFIYYILNYMVFNNNKYLPLYIIEIISIIQILLSSIYLEKGNYSLELGKTTYPIGSTFSLIFYFFIFLTITIFVLNKKIKKDNKNIESEQKSNIQNDFVTKIFLNSIIIIAMISVLYLYSDLIAVGIPLLNSTLPDRISFFEISKLPFTKTLYTLNLYYFPMLISFNYIRKKNKLSLIYIILIVVYLLLLGFKISGPIEVLFSFLLPQLVTKIFNKKINFSIIKFNKYIFKYMIIVLLFLIINFGTKYSSQEISTRIIDRAFGMTSHIHWGVINYLNNTNYVDYWSNMKNEFESIINQASIYDNNYGIARVMYNVADPVISKGYLERNTRMGSTFITIFLFNYGYILTIIFCIIFAIIYANIIKLLYYSILKQQIIKTILIYKIYIFYNMFIFKTGTLVDFFNTKNLFVIIVLILLNNKIKRNTSFKKYKIYFKENTYES